MSAQLGIRPPPATLKRQTAPTTLGAHGVGVAQPNGVKPPIVQPAVAHAAPALAPAQLRRQTSASETELDDEDEDDSDERAMQKLRNRRCGLFLMLLYRYWLKIAQFDSLLALFLAANILWVIIAASAYRTSMCAHCCPESTH